MLILEIQHVDSLEWIKGMNPSSMPPCQYVLLKKVLRSNYVSYLWHNAHLRDPTCRLTGADKRDESIQYAPMSVCTTKESPEK